MANRQTGYDWTFSVPKSVSLYLARTEDPLVEKLAHQALAATMDEAEARMNRDFAPPGQGSIFSAREQLRRGGKAETAAPFQETEL